MSGWGSIIIAGLGGALLLVTSIEFHNGLQGANQPKPDAVTTADTPQSSLNDTASVRLPLADIGAILGRPLFNWNRRPGQSSGPASIDGPLPRLAGILVSATARYAIFAAPPGGKPQVMQEGSVVGRFTIDKITASYVLLKAGGEVRTLHTSFGVTPPPPMATPDAS